VITVAGSEELNATLRALEKSAGRLSSSALIAGGKLVEGESKRSIQSKSTGRNVKRHRSGGTSYDHVAAGAGNAPNTDTGALVKSIQTEVKSDGVYVGTSLEYGAYLETGTSKMDERPWLSPALDAKKQAIVNLQIDAVNKSIQGSEHNV